MEIKLIEKHSEVFALVAEDLIIHSTQDAAELLMNCLYSGTNKMILKHTNLDESFFNLKTGLAGDILQKFSTYDGYLAIVGDFSEVKSDSLRAFIRESNKVRRINFVGSVEEGYAVLSG
ncbi:MAG: DUF4180 domain-containing protein [Bacteroidetes bacterium]|nr:DUF4180 domain-containing protein [Bacteroidota bacterium]